MVQQYPPISELLNLNAISGKFGVMGDAIDQAVAKLRYRDLIVEASKENDAAFYSLRIVSKELSVDLLGSGLKLIFLPAEDAATPASETHIAFEYRWPVLKYVSEFQTLSFAGTGKAFFNIFLELVDITEAQFLTGIVECFIDDPAPYQALINKLKTWSNGNATPLSGLTLLNQPVGYTEIEYILQQVTAANVDVFESAFEAVVDDLNDLDGSIDKLVTLFQRWLGGISRDDIEQLLLPQFSLALQQVAMAIEVPRSVLIPLDINNEPIDDATKHSRLTFTASGVSYDSSTGFAIELDQNIAASFTKSIIPGFGMTLEFDDIKIDLSRTTNIAEADAEGRPVDFMGVYVGNAVIGLPKKWFDNYQPSSGNPVTLGIVGRNLLIGTGGVSGMIGLEVIAAGKPKPVKDQHQGPEELQFVLGKQPATGSSDPRKGFILGFSIFDMKFRQNVLLESKIKGSMTIPKFDGAPIGIELFIAQDGDFKVTASVAGGHLFEAGTVFSFRAMSLSVEKDDNRVFAEVTGDLSFSNNPLIGQIISAPIHIEKLRIGSDGSFEIEGGTIPLPESVVIPLGPAKIAITAIHCGAHEQEHGGVTRKYRYWGFDGGINVNPGGIDARGDGIKYYYTVDDDRTGLGHHHFLRIEGIGVKLVIPGTASKESAVLILEGYLALKNPVYQGSISFQLPKVKIAGGASMAYNTEVPAWLIDVWLELPKPIPLGATGLGIYGFRGLFGLRYVASKEAVPALEPDASWGDYYRAAPKGVSYTKFVSPPATKDASNPFSVGVGVSLATAQDGGKAFTSQLFLLVSIPNLILLEGRADVLAKKRVGLTDEDPPYYAYLALSPESVELGAGISYRLPKETGAILDLNAVFEAAFFFHNRNAWYVHFGTKDKPNIARVISMFDGYGYLMLSASGIEAGTGVHYDFAKKYGPVAVSAHAYLDMWAYVSFDRPQAGGGIALGGYVDVKVLGVGFYIELAAGLTVEVSTPFRVAGYVEICVTVNLKVKKFHKCVNLEFVWERSNAVDASPIYALGSSSDSAPAVGIHMASGATYAVEFSSSPNSSAPPAIPLDTYIDVKFSKPVVPLNSSLIGGFTNPPSDNTDIMPPQYGSRIVTHSYALEDVKLEVWSSATSDWIDYHPFVALAPEALVGTTAGAHLADLPIGFWQKQEPGYTQIRFLALTPFNYMEPIGGYRPEEMGLTAQTIFCQGRTRSEKCLLWNEPAIYSANTNYYRAGILFRIEGADAAALHCTLSQLAPISLGIKPGAQAIFLFPKPVVSCRLFVVSTAPQITIRYQRRKPAPFTLLDPISGLIDVPYAAADFEDVTPPTVVAGGVLINPVIYNDPAVGIDRIIIAGIPAPDMQTITALEERIELRREDWVRADPRQREAIGIELTALTRRLESIRGKYCVPIPRMFGPRVPSDWQCGTFVHEVCWLSEEDWQHNQTIPSIAAIEADFHNMRAAVESTIAPIWRPNQVYRITLKVSDTIDAPSSPPVAEQLFYVHFRTDGPIGYFAKPFVSPPVTADGAASQPSVPDDGRDEIPERALKFYIDMERSYPDPGGSLLYAKPLYYGDVILKLFLSKPYAYHFFAEWPAYPPANPVLDAAKYAIEIRIKDPTESEPSTGTPDHSQALLFSALIGTQTWVPDTSPRRTEDIKILDNFRHPETPAGTGNETACLSTGGDPIIPAAQVLNTEIKNLEPNRLYTAVVLNKRLDASLEKEAEVHRYPFTTSRYRDFRTHIESYRLKVDANNNRLAVFKVSHDLAAAVNAPPIYDAAMKIIKREPTTDTIAYPDFFDRLVHACLKLDPLPPAATLEFNFLENALAAEIYGLWIRSLEPFNDPRIPLSDLLAAIEMQEAGAKRGDARILLSKDCCEAFVMIEGGAFPAADVSFKFAYLGWDNDAQMYVASETITTDRFSVA